MLLIPETLRTFVREFPDIRLRISEELYVQQLQKLRAGEVDVTIGGIPEDLSTGEFFVEPLIQTTMVATARKGSPWLQARKLADTKRCARPRSACRPSRRAGRRTRDVARDGLDSG